MACDDLQGLPQIGIALGILGDGRQHTGKVPLDRPVTVRVVVGGAESGARLLWASRRHERSDIVSRPSSRLGERNNI